MTGTCKNRKLLKKVDFAVMKPELSVRLDRAKLDQAMQIAKAGRQDCLTLQDLRTACVVMARKRSGLVEFHFTV